MPKILLNPYRNNLSIAGITLRHDTLLDQAVRTDSDVVFNSLVVGDITASGNITFTGNVTQVNTEHLLIEDNIIDINAGNDNPLMNGGVRIQRGPGLTPFDLLWNETQRLFKIGMGDAMSAVATREDKPVDRWLAVWNSNAARFDTTDKLAIPLTLGDRLTLENILSFGAQATAPPVIYRSGNDLIIDSDGGNILVPGPSNRESALKLTFNRRLDFEQSSLQADALGTGILLKTDALTFSREAAGRLVWPSTGTDTVASIFADNGTLHAEGTNVAVRVTDALHVDGPQIQHGVATFTTASGGIYRLTSQVDFQFTTQSPSGTVDVPKLTVNGKKASVATDDSGNTSVSASGDLYLDPASTVFINTGKRLAFAGSGVRLSIVAGDAVLENSSGAIRLAATDQVTIPSGVTLKLGTGSSLAEDATSLATVLASALSDVFIRPGPGKAVQVAASTPILLGGQPVYGTASGDIVMSPTGLLTLAAGLGVRVPVNTPLQFGTSGVPARMYRNAGGSLNLENDRSIIITAAEGVTFSASVGIQIGSTGGRIYQDVEGSMTLASGTIGNPTLPVTSASPFFAANTNSATDSASTTGLSSLATAGGLYVGKNVIVKQTSALQGSVTIGENIKLDGNAVIPVRIVNASETNGVAMSLTSKWDTTSGFTIGRGSPSQGGGRALIFTVPSYAYYGVNARPSFIFGSSRGDAYMELSDTRCTLSAGTTLNITSSADNALLVSGGSTLDSLRVTNEMRAGGDTVTVEPGNGTLGNGTMTINGKLALTHAFGELVVNGDDPIAGSVFSLRSDAMTVDVPTTLSSLKSLASATFAGTVLVTGGILDMSSGRITNLSLPSAETDACSKLYTDSVARGNTAKQAVAAATTGPVDLTVPIGTVDDISINVGDRVLVFMQDNAVENGLYSVAANGLLSRTADLATGQKATGSSVFVTGGTVNGTTGFVVVGSNTVVGTDPLLWTPFSGASMIKAGVGIGKQGNTFSVRMDDVSIGADSSGNIKVKDTYFTRGMTVVNGRAETNSDQSHVVKLGRISTAEWQASTIAVPYGGTGNTSLVANSLLTGNGTGPLVANEGLYYSDQLYFGVGTRDPRSQLHVKGPMTNATTGTWLTIEDNSTSAIAVSSGMAIMASSGNTARIAQRGDGILDISQNDLTTDSRIQFSTKQTSRMVIDSNGNVIIGGSIVAPNPMANCRLSVLAGSIGTTGDIVLGGEIRFTDSVAVITADSVDNGTLRLTAPVISLSGEMRLEQGSAFNMQGFQVHTNLNGGTEVYASGTSGVAAPLRFKSGIPSETAPIAASATVLSDGFLVPKLQIGGNENDRSLGFIMQTEANGKLAIAPGTLGRNVIFKGPVQMADALTLVSGSETDKAINMFLEGHTLYVQPPFSVSSSTYSGHGVIFGGGNQDLITTLGNRDLSHCVRYDPVSSTPKHPGGIFSVSKGILTTFSGSVQLADSLQFAVGNAAEGVVSAIGWYYLGRLGAGRTIMGVPGGWTLRLDYDGTHPYTATLFSLEKQGTVAFLSIYVTPAGVYEMFLRTAIAPCRFSVYQSPSTLSLSQYEGGGAAPSGEYSAFVDQDYRLDYDLGSAQANANMECGGLKVLGSAQMNNASFTGSTRLTGEFILAGQAVFTGTRHVFQDAYTNLPGVTISHDRRANDGNGAALFNSLTVHGAAAAGSAPSLCLRKGAASSGAAVGMSTVSMSLIPDDVAAATANAGGLNISHNALDSSSRIVLSTRAKNRIDLDDAGTMSILVADRDDDTITLASASTSRATFHVLGSARFAKRVVVEGVIASPEIQLGGLTNTSTVRLTGDVEGNLLLSHVSGDRVRLRGLQTPVAQDDAATRGFVEDLIQGLSPKDSVAAATNAPLDLTSIVTTLDGVLLSPGQRILVKDNINKVENGIYIVRSAAAPVRSDDMELTGNASAAFVFVASGDVNASSGWVCAASVGHATVGVNDLVFTQFSGAGHITAGLGLEKTGNQLRVLCDGTSIEVGSNKALRISGNALGPGLSGGSGIPLTVSSITHLDALGTVRAGTWAAQAIGMGYGGTGATNFAAGRIPYSNGVALTQGKLYFDDVNVRLGINTTTPTSGLTVEDRDVQLTSSTALSALQSGGADSPAASCALMFTAIAANRTFAVRNTGTNFVVSAGTGTNKLTLVDVFSLDTNGALAVKRDVSAKAVNVGPTDTPVIRWDVDGITRTVGGPLIYNLYSSDNSGASMSFYGGLGVPNDHTNSEFMRMGFYNGSYVVATTATGTGSARNLKLQAAGNVDQLVVKADGGVSMSGPVLISSTAASISDTSGGALTVFGGGSFAGTLRAKAIRVTGEPSESGIPAVNITGNTNIQGIFSIEAAAGSVSQAPVTTSFAVACDANSGAFSIVSNSTEALASISSSAANNGGDVALHILGLGNHSSESNEGVLLGFSTSTKRYELRTFCNAAGRERPLLLSAAGAPRDQLRLSTDGSIIFQGAVYNQGRLIVTDQQDATNSLGTAAVNVAGGVAVAKSIHVGTVVQVPQVRITSNAKFSNSGSLDSVSVGYSKTGSLDFFDNATLALNIHTGASQGPFAAVAAQEKLSIGHSNEDGTQVHVVRSTRQRLLLSSGVASRILTLDDGSSPGNPAGTTGPGALLDGYLVATTSIVRSDSLIQGNSYVAGSQSVGILGNPAGKVLSLSAGGNSIAFVGKGGNEFTLQTSSIFSISRPSDNAVFFSVDTTGAAGLATLSCPLTVRAAALTTSAFPFQILNASGNRMFSFDTIDHLLDLAGGRVVNSASPLSAGDLCNKLYVDNLVKGLNLKAAVTAASDVNVDLLRPVLVIDNVTLLLEARVLLMGQTNSVENGIYTVIQGNYLARANDFASGSRAAGAFSFVQQGQFKGDKGYVCIADYPNDIVGQNPLRFSQFNGNMISAGIGLYKDGNNILNIALAATGSALSFDADRLRVDPSIAGKGLTMGSNGVIDMDPITELADVTIGRYMASVIDVPFGGTGNNGFPLNSVVYSDGSKLIGNPDNLAWHADKRVMGINGPADLNNYRDGLTMYHRDALLVGHEPSFIFGTPSADNLSNAYNWRLRKQEAPRMGNLRDIPNGAWTSVTFSGDGVIGVVQGEPGSPTYITKDGGYQFDVADELSKNDPISWGETSISGNGEVVLCCGLQDYLYLSRGGGTFQAVMTDERRGWEWSSVSYSGQFLLASTIGQGVYQSRDAGDTWQHVSSTETHIIGFVHVIRSGEIQFIGYWGGGVLVSRDYGATFTEDTFLPQCQWWDMVEAKDSGTLATFACPGFFYISEDVGLTWQERFTDQPRDWNAGAISADGSVIAGTTENGYSAYVSIDRGVTVTPIFTSSNSLPWMFISVTDDGKVVFAGGKSFPVFAADLSQTIPGGGFGTFQVSAGNVQSQSAHLTSDNYLFYTNNGSRVNRYNLSQASSNLIFSGGDSGDKAELSDVLIMTPRRFVGIGYTAEQAADISSTLDVRGTMQVSGPLQLDTPLSTVSGGTGTNDLPYGMLIAGGHSQPYFSTGKFVENGVPIGNSEGVIEIVAGAELRERLGVAMGSQVQAYSANLSAISDMTPTTGTFIVGNGSQFQANTVAQVSTLLGLKALALKDTIDNSNWTAQGAPLALVNGGTGSTTYTTGAFPWYNGDKLTSGCLRDDTSVAKGAGIRVDGRITVSSTGNSSSNLSLLGKSSLVFGTEAAGNVGYGWYVGRDQTTNEFLISGTTVTAGSLQISDLNERLRIALDGTVHVKHIVSQAGLSVESGPVAISDDLTVGSLHVIGASALKTLAVSETLSINGPSTFASDVDIQGDITAASDLNLRGTLVVEQDTGVPALASGLTVASNQGGFYNVENAINDSMRHVSLISNIPGASTIFSLRNISAGGRGWDVIVDGNSTAGNKMIFQSSPIDPADTSQPLSCLTIDANSGAIAADGPASFGGNVSCGADVTARGDVTVTGTSLSLRPRNVSATATLSLSAGGHAASLALTSSGAATLANTDGSLAMRAKGNVGIAVAADTGDITADGKCTIASTANASDYNNGGALTVKGGAAVAGSVFIKGDVTVSGVITGLQTVSTAALSTATADTVNVSQITVKSARLTRISDQIMLTANFKVSPTAGSANTVFTFSLPNRTTPFVERLDIDTAQCSGFSDDVNLIVLQNILCTGVAGATKAVVQFQSVDTTVHYLQVFVSYRAV